MPRPSYPTDFAYRMLPVGDTGQRVGHVGAICGTCGHEEWVRASNPGWGTRLFKQRGWMLGNRRTHDECPSCAEKRLMPKPKPITLEKIVTTAIAAVPVPAAEPPKQPTWADNRRIRATLDDVYDADEGRYLGDNSDEKVARYINLPRAWVTAIRELFGPDRCEADEERRGKLQTLMDDLTKASARALEIATEVEDLLNRARSASREAGIN